MGFAAAAATVAARGMIGGRKPESLGGWDRDADAVKAGAAAIGAAGDEILYSPHHQPSARHQRWPGDDGDVEPLPPLLMKRSPSDILMLSAAMLVSMAIVAVATRSLAAVAGFVGGVIALSFAVQTMVARRPVIINNEESMPDWSVTNMAIEQCDGAMAVTDRAGRMVCANHHYAEWFGPSVAPPDLPYDEVFVARMVDAARIAWRDGRAMAADLAGSQGKWCASVQRAGRAGDFLIWRFKRLTVMDPLAEFTSQLEGRIGRILAKAGFAAAIVDAAGTIQTATPIFANAATGNQATPMVGMNFVAVIISDEEGRIFWARDKAQMQPLTLFHFPVIDPDSAQPPDPDVTPWLMLVIEANVGIGGTGSVAIPQLEAVLASLPLGLAMADRDGRLLFANPAFMRAAGRDGEEPPSWPTDLVINDDKPALSDAVRRFGRGPAAVGGVAVRLASIPDEPVSLSLAGMRGVGEAAVLLGLTDTSEETRLKRQIAQATKMQAVGQLAGGVAHDFNNVLTAIIGTCDLMLLRHTPGDSDYDDIQQIRANSNRAASLTRQLLAFSRQQTLRPQVLQLPDIVAEISQMLRRLIGEKIDLVVSHDRELGTVRADPTQLEQVIVNLVVNARDAIQNYASRLGGDGSGRLTLATRRVMAADVRAMRSEILPAADYTALIVEDTGGGIPPDHLGKIWEPFFTTKELGKGTGLGLSTVYGIVKQSGGFIFAENVTSADHTVSGARFSIYLPVYHIQGDEAANPGAMPGVDLSSKRLVSEEATVWSRGGDILLVEDEDTVRVVAERALTRAGYKVTSAADGDEGLEKVEARIAANVDMFDLVVSDVVMPSMDGPAMARAIRLRVPELPVLFMSGYAEEQLRHEINLERIDFLAKPFSVQHLSSKVAEIIALSRNLTAKK